MAKIAKSVEEQLEDERQRQEWISQIIGMAALWALSFAILYFTLSYWPSDDDLWRPIVLSTTANTVFFGAFQAIITKTNYDKVISGALVLCLGGSRKLFDQIADPVRKKFVAANLRSSLGDDTGDAVFSAVVEPLMAVTTAYRTNFVYDVRALDTAPSAPALNTPAVQALYAEIAAPQKYFWIEQTIGYVLRRPIGKELEIFNGPYEICLAFDETSLGELLRDEKVFFREVIKLTDAHAKALLALEEKEMEEFVRAALQFSVREHKGGAPVRYKVRIDDETCGQPILRLKTDKLSSASESDGIEISFHMPQLHDVTRFVCALPQPTQSPVIRFQRNAAMTKLAPVTFMPNQIEETAAGGDPQICEIKVKDWAFPTSGVVFTWQNR